MEPSTRTRRWALAAIVVIALLCALWWGSSTEADGRGPRPSETRAGRGTLSRREAARRPARPEAVPDAVGSDADAVEVIAIRLGTWGLPRGKTFVFDGLHPEDFWPTPEEAPLPDDEDVTLLLDALFDGYRDKEERARVAELAAARRADVLPEDPWAALLALEVERLAAEADRAALVRELLEQREAEGRADDTTGYEAIRTDYAALVRLAEEAAERWPGQPVEDYAALCALYAQAHPSSGVRSPDAVADLALDVLERSGDAIVRQGALTQLANVAADVKLGPEGLDLLLEVFDAPGDEVSYRHAISVAALESALALGDDERARAWMGRHDLATDAECAPEVVAWRTGTEGWCRKTNQARDNRSSWLAARGVVAPTTWQAAVGATARRCHEEGRALGAGEVIGRGTWSGGWSWTDWSASSALAGCVASAPHEGPEPPDGARVELHVFEALPGAPASSR